MNVHVTNDWTGVLAGLEPFRASNADDIVMALSGQVGASRAWLVKDDEVVADHGLTGDEREADLVRIADSERPSFTLAEGDAIEVHRLRIPTMNAVLVIARNGAPFDAAEIEQPMAAAGSLLDLVLVARERRSGPTPVALVTPTGGIDTLTGALNRDSFLSLLDMEFSNNALVASVIFLGIDGLGVVNDTLSFEAGDTVLQSVRHRLGGALRSVDTLARIGGDQFAIYLPGMTLDVADHVAARLQQRINAPFHFDSTELTITASAGIAERTHAENTRALLANASTALQAAKERGNGGRASYDKALEEGVVAKRRLIEQLQSALENNRLNTGLEPIVALPSGDVVAAEARVRWMHPERGLVESHEFLEAAERIGRSGEIERALIRFALSHAEYERREARSGLRTSLNISGSTLRDPHATAWVVDLLRESGDAGQLMVEVSEGAVGAGGPDVAASLQSLREAGASVVLDDFGVHLGSFRTLHAFPFDGVKLHQNLLSGEDGRAAEAVCRAVYAAADVVGFDVIHTGVDTERDLWLLKRLDRKLDRSGFYAQGRAVRHHGS